jgi:SOS-response transcriptional repressor LexA
MQGLTARQQQCFDFIRERAEKGERPPTLRDICKRLGVRSTNWAWTLVDQLRFIGLVVRGGRYSTGTLVPQRLPKFKFLAPYRCSACDREFYGERCPCGRKP